MYSVTKLLQEAPIIRKSGGSVIGSGNDSSVQLLGENAFIVSEK
jgi:hypothetical protein